MFLGDLKLFYKYIIGDIKKVILIVILTFSFVILEGVSIGALIPVLEFISDPNSLTGNIWVLLRSVFNSLGIPLNLTTLLLMVLVLLLIKEPVGYFRRKYAAKIRFDFIKKIRKELFDNIVNADLSYFHNVKAGNLVNTLSMESDRAGAGLYVMIELVTALLIVLVYFGLLLIISWQITLIALFVILLVSLLMNYKLRKSREIGIKIVNMNNQFNNFIVERLAGIRLIKSAISERKEADALHRVASETSDANYRFALNGAIISLIFDTVLFSSIVFIVYFAIEKMNITLPLLITFLYVMMRISPSVQQINGYRHELGGYMASFKNVLNLISGAKSMAKIVNGNKQFDGLKDKIEFKKVCFSYTGLNPVLKDVDLTIKKGEMAAIVGSSGAGKSTLVDLILRLYDPTDGQILIDGVDLKEFDLTSYRKNIGFVSQDIFLFNDTVAANICYESETVEEDTMIQAAKIAHAHEFIMDLPEGYYTLLGDRGVKLSGGQKQRLVLARTIYKNPKILILDEATSALDTESERLVQDSLNKIGRNYTTIAIAHRLSTIERADNIFVLEQGKIVESGNHEDLLKKGGYYAKYYYRQFGNNVQEES